MTDKYEFVLPDIGEGISEAMLINWSVKTGDRVEEGDEVATISTDKVDVELPSPRAGIVAELCWSPGDTIQVGSVFLRIDTENEAAPEARTAPEKPAGKPRKMPRPATSRTHDKVVAAPSTRKHAKELNVDLRQVPGSGTEGRILRRDVDAALAREGTAPEATQRETPSGVRATMAERMANSVHVLAHSTMNFEACADDFVALLEKLETKAAAREVRVSPTALFAKCVAAVLRSHPRFNATIDEGERELILHDGVNLGIAVASKRGLVVPVVDSIHEMSLFAVARHLADVTARGRDGTLAPSDMKGGTFTLSNTGNLERATVTSTRPIINAPQTAILWVSRIAMRPRVVDGGLEAGPMVSCSLSFDHRFIDGADAVAFVNDMADHIECPEQALAAD